MSSGTDIQEYNRTSLLSRRGFVKLAACSVAVGAGSALLGCDAFGEIVTGEHAVTDDAGRELTIPTAPNLERIYFTSALAQIFCFTLAPDLLAGTGIQFTKAELALLPEDTVDLPYLGTLSGGAEIDREALLVEDVQVVFSISSTTLTDTHVSEAEELQEQTGIPVILIDGSFERIATAYRLLGACLGQDERAEGLAAYCEDVYTRVVDAVATIPEDERITLYYAEGPEGLQTEPKESEHALTFLAAGAENVAQVELTDGVGMTNVSLESVLLWDPEVIIAWDREVRGGADEDIRVNPDWEVITACSTGRVYTMPNVPFAWCDRPPGVNRFLGLQWVANMLYPDAFDVDMVEVVEEFYELFYWVTIDDVQAKELLSNSYPPYRG